MENARLLVLELIFNVHRSIHIPLLASMVGLEVEECKEWINSLISKQSVDLSMMETCVKVNHMVPSLYGCL